MSDAQSGRLPDGQPLAKGCGRTASTLGAGFECTVDGPHVEHQYRGRAASSRGLGWLDHAATEIVVTWRDDRPPATVGDLRRPMDSEDAR